MVTYVQFCLVLPCCLTNEQCSHNAMIGSLQKLAQVWFLKTKAWIQATVWWQIINLLWHTSTNQTLYMYRFIIICKSEAWTFRNRNVLCTFTGLFFSNYMNACCLFLLSIFIFDGGRQWLEAFYRRYGFTLAHHWIAFQLKLYLVGSSIHKLTKLEL